jgi:hypothetical protein
MAIDTGKVENRRKLKFDSVADILADVERLNQSKFTTLGNWSGGQILKHLAIVMNDSIDGSKMRLSFPVRILGRTLKGRVLKKGMTPGFQLNRAAAEILVPPETSWEEGVQVFRRTIHRLQTETRRMPHPFFGSMTSAEWESLHCRHSELHLGFLVPATA